MGLVWKQGVAWVRVAAVVATSALVGCGGAKSAGPGCAGSVGATPAPTAAAALRVGVYDSRAVAVAYGRSKAHAKLMAGLMEAHAKAKAAGDAGRVEELNKQGERIQMRLHLQAFSDARVDDAIESVRDQLGGVMSTHRVSVLASKTDATMASVELVDVTEDLVKLFAPDAATISATKQVAKTKALPIEQVAMMPVGK